LHYTETMTGYAEESPGERRTTAQECHAAATRLRKAGFDATAEVRNGDPTYQLLTSAREHEAGLMVIGTRGQSGQRRLILGSVARKVLLHASCSVLVVREGARLDGHRIGLVREERELIAFG
jgi:nucleotide-binding universal stress UspA family protein